jgi:hypothetical protein
MRPALAAVAGLAALLAMTPVSPASAFDAQQSQIVSANPQDNTPDVITSGGQVHSLAQIGNTIVAGGTFSQVQNHGGGTTYTRNDLFSFDATSGAVSPTFAPNLDGAVESIVKSPDGIGVIVAGSFHHVNGVADVALAELRLSDGSIVSTFKVPTLDGTLYTMSLVGNRLLIGGYFKHVAGKAVDHLASLNPLTGALDTTFTANFTGMNNPSNPGATVVYKMDASPNGQRLMVIGNFMQINGADRPQIAMLDITTSPPTLVNWETDRYRQACASGYQTYMRDVEFSPDGSYFAVVTTGGNYDGTNQNIGCDQATRWETNATGTGLSPTWVDFTGNDTLQSVAITGTAVYTGGHNRWMNNAYGSDSAGPGAVDRPGLSALDPATGVPFDWNPTRTTGVGVFDLLATSTGLWIGDDTDLVGHETHKKLAFFPLSGGTPVPAVATGSLPSDVYLLGTGTRSTKSIGTCGATSQPGAGDTVIRRHLDPNAHPVASGPTLIPTQATAWSQVRGAFMLNNTVYTGWSNGDLCAATFNGSAFGSPLALNLYNNKLIGDLPSVAGMFFSGDRIYYTRAGSSNLSYRYFVPESGIVGAVRYNADNLSDVDFSKVGGMFLSGGKLYFVTNDNGRLHQVGWTGTSPTGTSVSISGPTLDGIDWTSLGMFLSTLPAANQPPTAQASASCTGLACQFSSAGSSDADGSIASYLWDFGDGTTGTSANPSHAYAQSGTYTARLTVTDNKGATGTATVSVRPKLR